MLAFPLAIFLLFMAWMTASGELENPVHGLEEVTAIPTARYGHTMVNISGTVYLFGGSTSVITGTTTGDAHDSSLTNDIWKYSEDTWTQESAANPSPGGRVFHAATAYGGKIYIFMGKVGESAETPEIWTYDVLARTWSQQPSLGDEQPSARHGHRAVPIGDRIYVFGGRDSSSLSDAYTWAYIPATGYWEKKSAHPSGARYDFSAANIYDQMVIWGGRTGANSLLADMWAYDPLGNQWYQLTISGTVPPATAGQATAAFEAKMWVFGGQTQSAPDVSSVWEFDITNMPTVTLQLLEPLQTARTDAAVAPIGQQGGSQAQSRAVVMLAFGGKRNGQLIDIAIKYLVWAYPPLQFYLPLVQRNWR